MKRQSENYLVSLVHGCLCEDLVRKQWFLSVLNVTWSWDPCYLTVCDYVLWAQVESLSCFENPAESVVRNNWQAAGHCWLAHKLTRNVSAETRNLSFSKRGMMIICLKLSDRGKNERKNSRKRHICKDNSFYTGLDQQINYRPHQSYWEKANNMVI